MPQKDIEFPRSLMANICMTVLAEKLRMATQARAANGPFRFPLVPLYSEPKKFAFLEPVTSVAAPQLSFTFRNLKGVHTHSDDIVAAAFSYLWCFSL